MSRRSKEQTASDKTIALPSGQAWANDRWTAIGVGLFLAAITLIVFGQTVHHDFVNYDDNAYVYDNPHVTPGLTLSGVLWAFTHVHSSNWHPLTWISHMIDCQLYGLNPGGHHLTNVLLHTATAMLLFLVLRRMTGFLWRSAFVAAVFAIHPLRVESVAWVAERKDVLSGLCFMLTLGAYVRYVQGRPGGNNRAPGAPAIPATEDRRSIRDYGLVLLFFALGLMCKPMLVTLPFVLLLLDYWPLQRFPQPGGRLIPWRLIVEKIPLLALSGAASATTLFAQSGARSPLEQISLPLRVGNAVISYVTYLGQMFWPSGLMVLYRFSPRDVGVVKVMLSLVVLAGISTGALVLRRRPYLLTGWLWYLLMLGPVIGIVWVGTQSRADRYTYLPQIGLYWMLTWTVAELSAGWRHRRLALGGGATIILAALIFCAHAQAAYWHNSETLWTHTLAHAPDNIIAHNNLGNEFTRRGQLDEAIAHYQTALRIKPDYAEASYNLAEALLRKGELDEAIVHYQAALQVDPNYFDAHNNLGNAFIRKGRVDDAFAQYQRALEINPASPGTQVNLGNVLVQKGRIDEAIAHYRKALLINPDFAQAHYNLSKILAQKGEEEEAISHYLKAVRINPDFAGAQKIPPR
ncbi:MAG TPA: tetratricopeptide repeat protein [Opitutaceae bacterium]|nr:tetratricopeptide repeat protein [Opitutaceae bacterium]